MNFNDYENKLKSATAENFQTVILDVMEDIKTDLAEKDTLADSIASKDAKIRELQDTNMKLFLSVGKAVDEKDPEETERLRAEAEHEQNLNELKNFLGGK